MVTLSLSLSLSLCTFIRTELKMHDDGVYVNTQICACIYVYTRVYPCLCVCIRMWKVNVFAVARPFRGGWYPTKTIVLWKATGFSQKISQKSALKSFAVLLFGGRRLQSVYIGVGGY